MLNSESLLTFIAASSLLSLAPGPDNIFVLTQSALYGRRAGILITLGLCTGLIFHTTAVALGVAAIFMVSATAFTALKLVGAAYLIYLAWGAFRASAQSLDNGPNTTCPEALALYRRGIIMNITNPKVAIFFLAFLPQFADESAGNLSGQLLLLGLVFILAALVIFSIIASLAGLIADHLQKSSRAQLLLNRTAALIFTALALRLATATR
jgi:threonine/homoserine/homoserine lactone efflux protein